MQFVYPAFLWSLLLVAIPILIHLFNFRKHKTVHFSNIQFLKEIKEETAARSKLKHWLVLFARILAIAALAFAFAQPFIPGKKQASNKGSYAVSIYVDNSFSMNARGEGYSLFEEAKQRALDIANGYQEDDRYQLLTNDFDANHQRLLSRKDFIQYLDKIEVSPAHRTLNEVVSRQKEALQSEDHANQISYVLSDFQKSFVDLDTTQNKLDGDQQLQLFPLTGVNQGNIFIDSCWLLAPIQRLNEQSTLLIRLKNTGQSNISEGRLTLKINDEVKSIKDFSVDAESYTIDTLSFLTSDDGWNAGELIIDDYPITFDDSYYFSFNVVNKINVSMIHGGTRNPYLSTLLQQNPQFYVNEMSVQQLDYAKLQESQLVILSDLNTIPSGTSSEIAKYLTDGGSVVVFPGIQVNLNSYNSFLQSIKALHMESMEELNTEVGVINLNQEVFQEVFQSFPRNTKLPQINKAYRVRPISGSGQEILLQQKNGNAFVSKYKIGKGKFYFCSSPLNSNYTDIGSHAIFVPMIYRMAILGQNPHPLYFVIGDNQTIQISDNRISGDEVFEIKNSISSFIPEQKSVSGNMIINPGNSIKQSGNYDVMIKQQPKDAVLAFNYNRAESEMSFLSNSELLEQFASSQINVLESNSQGITQKIVEARSGKPLWKLCIIFALAFLLVETLLLRLLPS